MKPSVRRSRSAQKRQLTTFRAELQHRLSPKRFALHEKTLDNPPLFLPASRLAALYGLATGAFVTWDDDNEWRNKGREASDFIHLYPRREGDYAEALHRAIVAAQS